MTIETGSLGVLTLEGRALYAGDIVHVHVEHRWLPVVVKWSDELGWYGRNVSEDNATPAVPLRVGSFARWPHRHFVAI